MENTLQVIETNGIQTVSARELYKGLEISKRFSEWFNTNSKDFTENEDFSRVYLKVQANRYGGEQEIQDYAISIDMAKAICLMSKTEVGKKYRTYLINLEKLWNSPEMVMKRAIQIANDKVEALEKKCLEDAPKVKAWESFIETDGTYCVTKIAIPLHVKPSQIFAYLEAKGWISRGTPDKHNSKGDYLATSKGSQKGYVTNILFTNNKISRWCLRVTAKGMEHLANIFTPSKEIINETAEAFINKGEQEYKKIVDETAFNYLETAMKNCPPSDKDLIPSKKIAYTIDEVAELCAETPDTIGRFCMMNGIFNREGKVINKKYMYENSDRLLFTPEGKDHLVEVFWYCRKVENVARPNALGKSE